MNPLTYSSGSSGLPSGDFTGKTPRRKVTTRSQVLIMGDIPVDTQNGPPHTGGPIPWEEVDRDVFEIVMMVT